MDEFESCEEALMQFTTMRTTPHKPSPQRGFTNNVECFLECGCIHSQGKQMEAQANDFGLCFQTIERGVSPYCELLMALLAAQILDLFVSTMSAVAHQRMDALVLNTKIAAIPIRAEVALRREALLSSTFALTPGEDEHGVRALR